MIREEYKRAFADILPDPALEARTERMAIQMRIKNSKPARRFSAALIAAIVFVLAAGIAVAATIQSGILDKLFIYDEPSEAAQEAVIHGGDSASDQGVTLAVTEYLMDGNSLHIGWNVRSEREEPVYYITSYELSDGDAEESVSYAGFNSSREIGDNILTQLSPDRPEHDGQMSSGYKPTSDAPVEATIHIKAYTTALTPVQAADDVLYPDDDEMDAYLARAAAGEIGVTSEGYSWLNLYPAYQEAYDTLTVDYDGNSDPDGAIIDQIYEDALVESGLMQPLTELSVTVSIPVQTSDPAKSAGIGESEFILPDRRVVIHEFSMDVASTVLRYDVYPTVDVDLGGSWPAGWWYLLVDPEGNVLNPAIGLNMDMMANGDEYEAGKPLCMTVECSGNPAVEVPEYVTFVPSCALDRIEGENSFDYYQRMAALADPEDCFRINLAGGE